jgi:hypothetical protein
VVMDKSKSGSGLLFCKTATLQAGESRPQPCML